jgi:hypothetical protein
MRGERLAVALQPDDGLHLGLGHVAMQADVLRPGRAAADELVRAVVRDGRRHREPDLPAIERPSVQSRAHAVDAGLPRHGLELGDVLAQRRAQDVHQAGDRLVHRAVGDHRRDHGAHPDVCIGAAQRLHALERRHGELERQIVGCGDALEHHLDRADLGAEIDLPPSVAVDHGAAVAGLERPAVAHALGQVAVAVRVGVDQPGMQQHARASIATAPAGRPAGRADLGDGVAGDENVAGIGAVGARRASDHRG